MTSSSPSTSLTVSDEVVVVVTSVGSIDVSLKDADDGNEYNGDT
jgi:hypothetical protein